MRIFPGQAAQAYAALKPTTSAGEPEQSNPAFKALHELAGAVSEGEQAAQDFVAGRADPHSVVEAVATAELAVETASVVRDRIVEAYLELLRMPI